MNRALVVRLSGSGLPGRCSREAGSGFLARAMPGLFCRSRLLEQSLSQSANVLFLIFEEVIGAGILRTDHAMAVDENQFRHKTGLTGGVLDVLLHLFALGETDGKVYAVCADEVRHQLRRVGIERRSQNLQTLRAEIFLDAAQNLSGVLTVRSSGIQERQQDHLPGILAQEHLAAAIHANCELTCGTRHLLGVSQPGQKRKRGEQMTESHDISVAQRVRVAHVSGPAPVLSY